MTATENRRASIARARLCIPKIARPALVRSPAGWRLTNSAEGLAVSHDKGGHLRVFLGPRHPYAQGGGLCPLLRFLELEEEPRRTIFSAGSAVSLFYRVSPTPRR